MLRFLRAPLLLMSLRNRNLKFSFSSKIETLLSLSTILLFISDAADLLFFFSDHYTVFALLGIFNNKYLFALMSSFGDYMWVINASFLAFSIILKGIISKQNGESLDFRKTKTPYFLVGDFLAACIELFVGLTFINPALASKKFFSSLIILGCSYKLTKILMI